MNRTALLFCLLLLACLAGGLALALGGESEGLGLADAGGRPQAPAVPDPVPADAESGARAVVEAAARVPPRPRLPFADPRFIARLSGVRGRLVDPQGRPLGGLAVEATTAASPAWQAPRRDPKEPAWSRGLARSGGDGRFAIEPLWWSEVGGLFLVAGRGSGWFFDNLKGSKLKPPTAVPGQVIDLGDLVLVPAAGVTGRVLSPDGQPAGGVAVAAYFAGARDPLESAESGQQWREAYRAEQTQWPHTIPGVPDCEIESGEARLCFDTRPVPAYGAAVTDEEGRYRIQGLGRGHWLITASVAGRRMSWFETVSLGDGEQGQAADLRLPQGVAVRGTVTDTAGRPVPGVVLRLLHCDKEQKVCAPELVPTDPGGRFEIDGFVGEKVGVVVQHPGTGWRQVFGSFDPKQEVAIRLGRHCTVAVRVLDGAGQPSEGHELAVITDQPWTFGFSDISHMELPIAVEDGQVRLPPGTYWFLAESAVGFAWQRVVVADTDQEVVLRIGEQQPFRLRVVDLAGEPLFAARVLLRVYRMGSWYERATERWTDAAGWVRFPVLGAGQRSVHVECPGYQDHHSDVKQEATEKIVALHRSSGLQIELQDRDGSPCDLRFMVELRSVGEPARFLRTGARDKQAARRDCAPGEYRLVKARIWIAGSDVEVPIEGETRIVVHEGEVTRATVRVDTRGVSGRTDVAGVVTLDGQPVQGLRVAIGPDPRGARQGSPVDAKGGFALKAVPFRRAWLHVSLRVGDRWQAIHTRELELQDRPVELKIDIPTGRLEAALFAAGGVPWPGGSCEVVPTDEKARGAPIRAVADRHGRLVLEHLPAGEYELARGSGSARASSAPFRVRAGQTTSGVVLTFPGAIVVSGRVEVDGTAGDQSALILGFDGVESSEWTRLAADGSFVMKGLEAGVEYTVWLRRPGSLRRQEQPAKFLVPKTGVRDAVFRF